jgi:hypothetical protein
MQEAELQASVDLLRGTKVLIPDQSTDREGNNQRRQAFPEGISENSYDDWGHQGVQRNSNGYRVVTSWAQLSISTVYTDSLAQAIDWQIALAWLRSTAQARLEDCIGLASDPLMEDELVEAMAAEPAMELSFKAMIVGRDGNKLQTTAIPCLAKALQFKDRLHVAAAHSVKRLEQTAAKVEVEAAEYRKKASKQKDQLLAACSKELEKRACAACGKTKGSKCTAPLKRPSSAQPVLRRPAASEFITSYFKPTHRIRSKSSPALLAILQMPSDSPSKSRHHIVSRAHAWQGLPQPGTPSRLGATSCLEPSTPFKDLPQVDALAVVRSVEPAVPSKKVQAQVTGCDEPSKSPQVGVKISKKNVMSKAYHQKLQECKAQKIDAETAKEQARRAHREAGERFDALQARSAMAIDAD